MKAKIKLFMVLFLVATWILPFHRQASAEDSNSKDNEVAIIVGSVVGGLSAIALIVVGLIFLLDDDEGNDEAGIRLLNEGRNSLPTQSFMGLQEVNQRALRFDSMIVINPHMSPEGKVDGAVVGIRLLF